MTFSVYVDPDGDPKRREYVEKCADIVTGAKVKEYLVKRLPPTDRVHGEFGVRQAGTKDFDFGRLREAVNEPINDGKSES